MSKVSFMTGVSLLASLLTAATAMAGESAAKDPLDAWLGSGEPGKAVVHNTNLAQEAEQQPDFMFGVYAGVRPGNNEAEFYFQLMPSDYYAALLAIPAVGALGKYSIDGTTFTMEDILGCEPGQVGTYTFAMTPSGIDFTLVNDDCAGRGQIIDSWTFNRHPAPVQADTASIKE